MKMIIIDYIVINPEHITSIVSDCDGKECTIYVANEAYSFECTLSDMIHYLELAGIEFATIDTKRQQVTVKEKPGQ